MRYGANASFQFWNLSKVIMLLFWSNPPKPKVEITPKLLRDDRISRIGNTFLQITAVVTTGTIKRTTHRMHLGNAILESFCILQCMDAIQYHFYAHTGFIYLRKQASSVLFYVEICMCVETQKQIGSDKQIYQQTGWLTAGRGVNVLNICCTINKWWLI